MLTKFTIHAALFLLLCLTSAYAVAQNPINNYTQVYSATIHGGTAVLGNTSMHIINPDNGNVRLLRMNEIGNPGNNQGGIGYTQYGNDDENMQFADMDADATTYNATSADLVLPAGTNTIKFARLYWGGRIDNAALTASPDTLRKVKLRTGSGAYTNITAPPSNVDQFLVNSEETIYQSYADITSYVQNAGTSTCTVANVPASPGQIGGGGKFAGWSIVIAYENPASLLNSIRVYHGYYQVFTTGNVPSSISVTLNGLNAPNNALEAGDAVMSVMGWEGDGNLGASASNPEGDFVKVNNIAIGNTTNIATNFWNGSITKNGAYVSNKNPNYSNQMGIDIDEMNVGTGYGILPNATFVTVSFGTEADQYFPSYFAFSLRAKEPRVTIQKTVADANNNHVSEPGEELTYMLKGDNNGLNTANNVFIVDSLPANVGYVPGSMYIIVAPGVVQGAQTDAIDNLDHSFKGTNGGRDYVKFFIGTNATGTSGGTLEPGQSYAISFKVIAAAISGSVVNTATSYATNQAGQLLTDTGMAVIGPAGGPLPVRLLLFTAMLNTGKNATQLKWSTTAELNNKAFIIERSEDAVRFIERATVQGNGTTGTEHHYAHTDPLDGHFPVLYYRLKMIDEDGGISYSQALAVRPDGSGFTGKMSIYPNPFASGIRISLSNVRQSEATFRIMSLEGKQVWSQKTRIANGDNIIRLDDLQGLIKGAYLLELITATERRTLSIIKL